MRDNMAKEYNDVKKFKLVAAIIIDLVGLASFLIPGIGEVSDVAWAPISALLISALFPNHKKMAIGGMIEEILPFTDIIPTAYLAWRQAYAKDKEKECMDL